eukprot:Nk52_evm45s1485 gene=Nk52_evmTU45s1485
MPNPVGQQIAQKQKTRLEHLGYLNIDCDPMQHRKSSIICTLGPKTNNVEKIIQLREAGMNIARMNFSHGSHEYHAGTIKNIRESFKVKEGSPIGIALDTKGPEIRTGLLKGDKDISITIGQEIVLTSDASMKESGTASCLYVDYEALSTTVQPGSLIFIDDGLISLQVVACRKGEVVTKAINAGQLGSRKGVNLPNASVELPALSEKDKSDLAFGVEQGVDMIFASFIRKADDVVAIRQALGAKGKGIKIICKIENHEGVRNFDEILKETDGVMVARGDLGIEIDPAKVFLAQKMMIAKCNIAGKPVICATQMLESMTNNPRPTRAEVSDVANAIMDGADCVMLSGETAKGQYPIESVRIMDKVCREAESAVFYRPLFNELRDVSHEPTSTNETLASSAVNAALEQHAGAIIVLTTTGTTARLIAKYRPTCPVLTVSRAPQTARQVHLYRGCVAIHYNRPPCDDWQEDVDARIYQAMEEGRKRGMLAAGDTAIAIQGWMGGVGHSNTMRLLVVPDVDEQ